MYTLVAWCIFEFIGQRYMIPMKNFTICALVLCYPVVHMATAPNNTVVIEEGTKRYFKGYTMLNIIDKLSLSFL